MAKAKVGKYDHFVKKGLKEGDKVKLIAEVNAMVKGTLGVVQNVKADGGAHYVEILTGPKHGEVHYILARDLEKA